MFKKEANKKGYMLSLVLEYLNNLVGILGSKLGN
jgi:hypothetical protein